MSDDKKPLAEVIPLNDQPIATCQCGCDHWLILVDGFGDQWQNIIGTKCANEECGVVIQWVRAEKQITQGDN